MKATVVHNLRITPELMERIDAAKGSVARNRFLVELIEEHLGRNGDHTAPAPPLVAGDRIVAGLALGVPGLQRASDLLPPSVPDDAYLASLEPEPQPDDVPRRENGHPMSCGCEDCLQLASGE